MARGDKQRFVSCNKHVSVLEESRNPIVRFAPRIIAPALLPRYICAMANTAMVHIKCERSLKIQILSQQEIEWYFIQKSVLFFILFVLFHCPTDNMLTVFKPHCIIYNLGWAQTSCLTKLSPQLNRFKQKVPSISQPDVKTASSSEKKSGYIAHNLANLPY